MRVRCPLDLAPGRCLRYARAIEREAPLKMTDDATQQPADYDPTAEVYVAWAAFAELQPDRAKRCVGKWGFTPPAVVMSGTTIEPAFDGRGTHKATEPGKIVHLAAYKHSLFVLTESGELWQERHIIRDDGTNAQAWRLMPGPTAADRPQPPKEKQHGTET